MHAVRAAARATARPAVAQQAARSFHASAASAVNPKELLDRIVSTQGIEKITKSMKMVSAAKLRGDQDRLEKSEVWFRSFDGVFPQDPADRVGDPEGAAAAAGEADAAEANDVNLWTMVTSDRGLCGGVNSSIGKLVKADVEDFDPASANPVVHGRGALSPAQTPVFVIGDKGRPLMQRLFPDHLTSTLDECWKAPVNFATASAFALRVLEAAEQTNAGTITLAYNRFKSAISYDTSRYEMANFSVGAAALSGDSETMVDAEESVPAYLKDYEFEPESKAEALQNLMEFAVAGAVYGACMQNAASEQSSRMSAMDNASKNAGEMIEKLTLQYNRARQAKITTELIEIISGAESLKG